MDAEAWFDPRSVAVKAMEELRKGGGDGWRLEFRYTANPSFSNPWSWLVHRKRRRYRRPDPAVRLSHLAWHRDLDEQRFPSLLEPLEHPSDHAPQMARRVAEITEEQLATAMRPLAGVHMPIGVVDHTTGLDGTTYELVVSGLSHRTHLRWWSDVPAEWEAVRTAVEEVIDRLDRLLPDHTTAFSPD